VHDTSPEPIVVEIKFVIVGQVKHPVVELQVRQLGSHKSR
jgi:hypothetical protein